MNFTFDEKKHLYYMDGKPMTGVTTILAVIAKPALISWAANQAVDFIIGHISELITGTKEKQDELLKEARSAHRKKKEKAGVAGTDVHAECEKYIKLMIQDQDGNALEMNGQEDGQVKNFIGWAVKNKVRFLASEERLYSEKLWIAGTLDMVFEMGGKKYIGDIKTSSAVYSEHFFQMSAYRMMWEEMGKEILEGSVVIRLGKDGTFNEETDVVCRMDDMVERKAFLGALDIYRANQVYQLN